MSDATKNWLILLVGVLAVAMMFKTFLDVTGFGSPIQTASSTSRRQNAITTSEGQRVDAPPWTAGTVREAGGTAHDHGRRIGQ